MIKKELEEEALKRAEDRRLDRLLDAQLRRNYSNPIDIPRRPFDKYEGPTKVIYRFRGPLD